MTSSRAHTHAHTHVRVKYYIWLFPLIRKVSSVLQLHRAEEEEETVKAPLHHTLPPSA